MVKQSKHVLRLVDAEHGDTVHFKGTVRKEVRFKDSGERFLYLTLSDRSGVVTTMCWQENPLFAFFDSLENDEKIEAYGRVIKRTRFTNLEISSAKILLRDDDWDFHLKDLKKALGKIIRGIDHAGLKNMLLKYFRDENNHKAFSNAPYSYNSGGCYKGGALVFVIRLCKLIDSTWNSMQLFSKDYGVNRNLKSTFNKDLLKTVAIFEAIGKTEVYEVTNTSKVKFTRKGNYLSERVITLQVVQNQLNQSSLCEDEKLIFLHLLASVTDGEAGQAVLQAKTREAAILNSLYKTVQQLMLFEELDKKNAEDVSQDEFYFYKRKHLSLMNFDDSDLENGKLEYVSEEVQYEQPPVQQELRQQPVQQPFVQHMQEPVHYMPTSQQMQTVQNQQPLMNGQYYNTKAPF
ncbi:OB-fold nucleic acid binding domain-containing protein [Lysinibacillus sp. UGB7]|uniref:OB-fold nucleic acid binding domain-containing protein n=1 Tax=Lysinibacillus sp. UGB7 TaxID=3411039 RepID=UPI003B7D6485